MRRLVLLVSMAIAASPCCMALPQFALLSGNRCSNCHISPAGGGLRTEMGWYTMHDVGILKREDIPWLYPEDQSNSFANETFVVGTDARLQSTRSFTDSNASRILIPMQLSLYGAYIPSKHVTIEGTLNIAALANRGGRPNRFPGQQPGLISAILQVNRTLPSLRVGLMRPSFGIRYDDHTVFPFSYVTPRARQNIFGPDWGEWGSELTWEYFRWLTVQAGVFGNGGLRQVNLSDGVNNVPALSGNSATVSGRVYTAHQFADNTVNIYGGASVLANNNFRMTSVFVGAGLTDHCYVLADVVQTHKPNVLTNTSGMVEVGWSVCPSAILYARYEHGNDKQAALPSSHWLTSAVFGAQVFVLPFVELRPEYRLLDTFYSGVNTRWNVQLHLFY